MSHKFSTLFLFLLIINFIYADQTEPNQIEFFELLNKSVAGYDWSTGNGSLVCDLRGVACDSRGRVTVVDLSGLAVSGRFPPRICEYLPELRVLRLGKTGLRGEFPEGVNECGLLEELDLRNLSLTGTIPDLSAMKSLRVLALSSNDFRGEFPMSVTNLTRLEVLDFNENGRLSPWRLPENISGLTSLTTMILATCMLYGPIPRSVGNMTSLVDLELSGNFLSGEIPPEIGRLANLRQLELYYNQLTGEIPAELGNLTRLVDVDMSVNHLSGSIPESLCRLPELRVLQLYNNSLIGEIPAAIVESTTLTMLSLYDNSLTGEVPRGLGALSPMVVFDLSENHLSGALPTEVCHQGKLQYFLVLDNHFSGNLPDSYGGCHSLLRFRVSNNSLQGPVPGSLLALPHVSIFDVAYNNLSGPIGNSIAGARNLSEVFMQNNRISGVLPYEISRALNLVKVDLSNNLISGPIPPEIGNLKRLNLLLLQGNLINSSIPSSLSKLNSVNVLDLSNNRLTGKIPESLSNLLPNSINFSNNLLSGPIPPSLIRGGLAESFSGNPSLCVESLSSAGKNRFPKCPERREQDRERRVRSMWAVAAASAVIILAGAVLLAQRRLGKHHLKVVEHDEAGRGGSGGAPSSSRSYHSYEVKSFHRISFDRKEILAAAMDEKNILGRGGSGTVYRVELKSKEVVAVKRLWSERKKGDEEGAVMDRELRTEVETLGSIRHKNIVKLYCYFSSADCNLLVYEYMPNGNLWDALHKGWVTLDWPTRHGIALGIAQGLSYLHHDLVRPIIHRDIKSTNILLDVNYQPKVADFGIAKVLQARGGGKDSTTTVIAGTYGYLAPEYAYLSKATTKCDVYSFGVVMMELITGKKPVEPEFGENKNIIYWVANKVETREGAIEVLDKSISSSFKDEMIQALRVAIRCTYKNPALRPTMKEVVQLLIDADPCRLFDATTRPQCKIIVSDGDEFVAKD